MKVLMCCCQNNDRCINSHHYQHYIMKNRKVVKRKKLLNRTSYKHFIFYSLYCTNNVAYIRLLSMQCNEHSFHNIIIFFSHKTNLKGSRTKTTKKKTKHEHNLLLTQIRFSLWCVYDPFLFSVCAVSSLAHKRIYN